MSGTHANVQQDGRRGRCHATLAAVFLFCVGGEASKKGPGCSTDPWPPDSRIVRKVEPVALRDHSNVVIVSDANPEKKRAAHSCTGAALGTNRRSLGGGEGGAPIHGNKLGRVHLVPEVEKEILAAISTAMLRKSRGRPTSTPARFHPALPSYSCRPAPDRRWLGSRIEA